MGRKILVYGAGLIALELILARATNFGTLLTKGGSAASQVVKTFQAR